jgi:hypothetical protein
MKRYLLTIIAAAAICIPAIAQEKDTVAPKAEAYPLSTPPAIVQGKDSAAPKVKTDASPFKFSAILDMQVEKQMYDEFSRNSTNRISNTNVSGYRLAFDDFWLRVALRGSYQLKNLESAFSLRFYPYWTLRRQVYVDQANGTPPVDILGYLDVLELNQAYIKVFKEYTPEENLMFKPHFKIGRDGLLNSCSQLFGNYLDQPSGGYGASRYVNITGPFKNRKVFANQLELGFAFNVFDMVGGLTSVMIGGNLNNQNFYNAAATQFFQIEDSKLSAGFIRAYQDLYFLDKRFHIGGGVRKYVSTQDSGSQGYLVKATYLSTQLAFDAVICKDVKFYTEMAQQQMSSTASTGIIRPINAGLTIPTFGVLDTLAIEVENVADTYLNDLSMRDPVSGRLDTKALGWGMVIEKRYFNRFVIDWGLFTGNATGDMKTTLRLTSLF